jgi:general secretion pathway protein A
MTWLEHFGLTDAPFSKEVQDADLWLPDSKRALVGELLGAIEERQTGVLLTGESGLGKSCVLRVVRHRLAETNVRLTYCHNATLGRRDFYRQLCHSLGLSPKATAASVFYAVSTHVQELSRERTHPVFLLDEAHLLHQDTLDHLHILTNYEWDSRALLTLVLVGLPELRTRMHLRCNRSLWSRIHCRLDLGEPLPADTVDYVNHRLRLAGAERDLFTSDALALLHEGALGILRDVDRLATAALRHAAARKLNQVDRALIAALVQAHEHR